MGATTIEEQQPVIAAVAPAQVADLETTPLLGNLGDYEGGDQVEEDTCNHDAEYSKDWAHLPWYRRPSIYLLLPPFSLFALAYGGVAVPRINIIINLICRDYYQESGNLLLLPAADGNTPQQCQAPEVQKIVSKFTLGIALIAGIISAFTSPRLGSLSDRYGRRLFMAGSGLGLFSSEIATILATKFPDIFSVNIFFVGAVIDGLCGSFMLGMALSYSYGADCTAPRKRAVVFGAFQGCFFLGVAVGPVLGGLLVAATGDFLSVFYVGLVLHAFFVIYVLGFLPESLSERRKMLAREKHERAHRERGEVEKRWWDHVNPVNLLRPLNILFPTGEGSSVRLRLNLLCLAGIDTILLGAGMSSLTVVILYSEAQFHWGNLQSSIFISIVNTTRVTILFLVLPIVVGLFRRNGQASSNLHRGSDMLDIRLIQFSVLAEAIGYTLYAVAPTGALFTAAGVCTALGGFASPTVQSSLTKHISSDRTGQLLGATALLHSLARVAAPSIFNLIYYSTVDTLPQAVFVSLGGTFVVAFLLSFFIKPKLHLAEEKPVRTGGDEETLLTTTIE